MGGTYLQPQHLEDRGRRVSMSVSSSYFGHLFFCLFVFAFSYYYIFPYNLERIVQFADEVSDTVTEQHRRGRHFSQLSLSLDWLAVLVR